MRLIATSVYFSDEGKPIEQHQLVAEFDLENEWPGEGAELKRIGIAHPEEKE